MLCPCYSAVWQSSVPTWIFCLCCWCCIAENCSTELLLGSWWWNEVELVHFVLCRTIFWDSPSSLCFWNVFQKFYSVSEKPFTKRVSVAGENLMVVIFFCEKEVWLNVNIQKKTGAKVFWGSFEILFVSAFLANTEIHFLENFWKSASYRAPGSVSKKYLLSLESLAHSIKFLQQ